MAKGEMKMTIDMIHNLFSLCSIQCLQTVCRYRRKDSLDCGRKDIIINASGECTYFEDISGVFNLNLSHATDVEEH